jgi:hypothetical protein
MDDEQVFCAECGTTLRGAKFCPQCGVVTENAMTEQHAPGNGGGHAAATAVPATLEEVMASMAAQRAGAAGATIDRQKPPPPVVSPRPVVASAGFAPPPTTEPGQKSAAPGGRRPLLIAAVGGLVATVIAVTAVVALTGGGGAAYATQARDALAPVIQANSQLTGTLQSLSPSNGSSQAEASAQATIVAVRAALRTLGTLNPGSGDQQFADNATAAMGSELAWLKAVVSVLGSSRSPMLSQLGSLDVDTHTKLAAIDPQAPGASASFAGSTALIAYVQNQSSAASTRHDLTQFSGQVESLLTQSAPAYQQINQIYGELQTAANGGTPDITLAQAEATLNTVVANRTSLAASTRTLNAPTPLATSTRNALVAALDASLTNDQDISTCLNQANDGTVAIIFQSCLTSTGSDASIANTAKQQFFTLYNQLRQQIGKPSTSQPF